MMDSQSCFEQIYTGTHHNLSAKISNDGLKLRLKVQKNHHQIDIYQREIKPLKDYDKLSLFFKSIKDLVQHIKEQDNIKFNRSQSSLTILMKTNMKDNGVVQLATIQLKYIKTEEKDRFDSFLQFLNKKQDLTSNNIIILFKQIINQLKQRKNVNLNSETDEIQTKLQNQDCLLQSKIQTSQQNFMKNSQQNVCESIIDKKISKIQKQIKNIQTKIQLMQNQLINNTKNNSKIMQNFQNIQNSFSQIKLPKKNNQQQKVQQSKLQHTNRSIGSFDKQQLQNSQILQKTQNLSSITSSNLIPKQKQQIVSSKWVDQLCISYKTLTMINNKITAKQKQFVFSKIKIAQKSSFTVTINVLKNNISLGIADIKYRKVYCLGNQPNWIQYQDDGYEYFGNQTKTNVGLGFIKGDKINVNVDTNKGLIEWKVKNQIRHKISHYLIKSKNIQWIPLIILDGKGDSVIINQ